MRHSKDELDFSPTSISVCGVILSVEAIGAIVSIGIFAMVSNSNALMGTDILMGSLALLVITLLAGIGVGFYARKRHQKSILMLDDKVSLKTFSGVDETVSYEEIKMVKNREEEVFIKMKDGRMIVLLPGDFKNKVTRLLFVAEMQIRILMARTQAEEASAQKDGDAEKKSAA